MITHETVVWAGEYQIRFTVRDDTEWLVSIDNSVLEVGTTSGPCQTNWNKGLAECIMSICKMQDTGKDNHEFLKAIQKCGFMDFRAVVAEMAKLVESEEAIDEDDLFDTMESSWGDQYDSLW